MSTIQTGPDLHVVSLSYKLRASDSVTYCNPPPVNFETEEARFRLSDGKLVCEMKTHFPDAAKARAVIEPVLRAWEVDADLRWNRGELRFEFEKADIIDRSPVPLGGNRVVLAFAEGAAMFIGFGTGRVHAGRDRYPEPPQTFRISPDVESLLQRYRGYLDGREPLLSMAYFCLTLVESMAGTQSKRRTAAAARYRISSDVLGKIGELTSNRGDHMTARKAAIGPRHQLSGPEGAWLEAAVKMLIQRVGDTRERTALPMITMGDLPAL